MIGSMVGRPSSQSTSIALNRQQVNPYSVLAFFGFEANSPKAFYEGCMGWFREHGITPNCGAIGRDRFHCRTGRFATISFDAVKYHLHKHGFEGVERLRLYALKSGGTDVARDAVLSIGWNNVNGDNPGFDGRHGHFQDAWVQCSAAIADLKCNSMMQLAQDLVAILSPAYGMGFRRDIEKGPTHYALGIPYGAQPYGRCGAMSFAEEKRITAWNNCADQQLFRVGIIREVCPLNFLNESHLRRQIRGQVINGPVSSYTPSCTLDQWARQAGCGELRRLGNEVWLWTIPDTMVPSVGTALERSGLVFDYHTTLLATKPR